MERIPGASLWPGPVALTYLPFAEENESCLGRGSRGRFLIRLSRSKPGNFRNFA